MQITRHTIGMPSAARGGPVVFATVSSCVHHQWGDVMLQDGPPLTLQLDKPDKPVAILSKWTHNKSYSNKIFSIKTPANLNIFTEDISQDRNTVRELLQG